MHSFGFSTHCFYSGSVYNLFMYIYNLIMYIEQEKYTDQINYNKKNTRKKHDNSSRF